MPQRLFLPNPFHQQKLMQREWENKKKKEWAKEEEEEEAERKKKQTMKMGKK